MLCLSFLPQQQVFCILVFSVRFASCFTIAGVLQDDILIKEESFQRKAFEL
jgi:hypothetical protein